MMRGLHILRLLLAACAATVACSSTASAYVYWTNDGPGTDNNGTTIGRSNLDTSGLTHSFITGLGRPTGLLVDGGHIYWANPATNSIGRANLNGTGADKSFVTGAAGPCGVAAG